MQVAVGNAHACVVTSTGDIQCWGENYFGQVGDGTAMMLSSGPVLVSPLPKALDVSAGQDHTCARTVAGAFCWGDNTYGELANGSTDGRTESSPVHVLNLP
jgi:alpha-tubulin suppressor-like RCC1 family protein